MSNRFVVVNRIRAMGGFLNRFTGTQRLRRGKNRVLNGWISRATTKRILQCKANFRTIRIWIALEQRVGCHDLPGDAKSALHSAMFHKGFLQWMQPCAERSSSVTFFM